MIEQSYAENRRLFLECAAQAGATCVAIPYRHALENSQNQQELVTDIALIGRADAPHVAVIVSGVHGVELPAGSLLQQIWLQKLAAQQNLLPDMRFVFVHAINPHGAAYGMRTDWGINGERNIDPARNFVAIPPTDYLANRDIAEAILGADLNRMSSVTMWARLLYTAFIKQGKTVFKRSFVRGQFDTPDIPYYGGRSPSLVRALWDDIIATYLMTPSTTKIWHLDCHTGDGPFGLLQLYINDRMGAHVVHDCQQLIEPDRVQHTGHYFADIAGDIVDYWPQTPAKHIAITPMTLEFGTSSAPIEGIDVLHAILRRTILQQKYQDQHPAAAAIIQEMRDAFAPRDPAWARAVALQAEAMWARFVESNSPPA